MARKVLNMPINCAEIMKLLNMAVYFHPNKENSLSPKKGFPTLHLGSAVVYSMGISFSEFCFLVMATMSVLTSVISLVLSKKCVCLLYYTPTNHFYYTVMDLLSPCAF
jgi:uncharacterized integral membrane protein